MENTTNIKNIWKNIYNNNYKIGGYDLACRVIRNIYIQDLANKFDKGEYTEEQCNDLYNYGIELTNNWDK